MKVFLDTNVVMDAIVSGREGKQDALDVISLGHNLQFRIHISSLSIPNIVYSARKYVPREALMEYIGRIYNDWKILSLGSMDIEFAMKSSCPDFEDALQITAAEAESDVIVTNNKKHFTPYTYLPVYTPREFLNKLKEHQF